MSIQSRFIAKNGLDNNSNTITNVANPVNAQDVVTKIFGANASNITTGTLPSGVVPDMSSTYVAKSGSTMTGILTLSATPTNALEAATKSYVDNLISGVIWLSPLLDSNLKDDSLNTPPSPISKETYIIGASPTGAWSGLAGHIVYWSGSAWVDILGRVVAIGDRFGVLLEYNAQTPAGGLTGKLNNIVEITTATPGSIAYTFTTPMNNSAAFISNSLSYHFGDSYTYVTSTSSWIEFSGPSAIAAGVGLQWTGNTLSLTNTGVSANTYGSSTAVPVIVVDAQGRITSVSTSTISSTVTLGGDISGTGNTGSTITTTLPTINSTVGTFGNGTNIPVVTVNAKGLVTSVTNTLVSGGATGGSTDQVFVENDAVVSHNYTIGSNSYISGITVTIANPAVFSYTSHPYVAGSQIILSTTGALPTGLSVDTIYYVISAGLTANAFEVSTTPGGSAVITTGSQSGVHSIGKRKNASSAGPVTIVDGVTVTIPTGTTWSII